MLDRVPVSTDNIYKFIALFFISSVSFLILLNDLRYDCEQRNCHEELAGD